MAPSENLTRVMVALAAAARKMSLRYGGRWAATSDSDDALRVDIPRIKF